MREKVEADRQAGFGSGLRGSESHGLQLLQPWVVNVAPVGAGGRVSADGPDGRTRVGRQLAVVRNDELDLGRSSAMVVMGQVLDAWRTAERQLAATIEGSVEQPQIQVQVATLRFLYQGLFARVRHEQTERRGG